MGFKREKEEVKIKKTQLIIWPKGTQRKKKPEGGKHFKKATFRPSLLFRFVFLFVFFFLAPKSIIFSTRILLSFFIFLILIY